MSVVIPPGSKQCPQCRQVVPIRSVYCPVCNHQFAAPAQPTPPQPQPQPPTPPAPPPELTVTDSPKLAPPFVYWTVWHGPIDNTERTFLLWIVSPGVFLCALALGLVLGMAVLAAVHGDLLTGVAMALVGGIPIISIGQWVLMLWRRIYLSYPEERITVEELERRRSNVWRTVWIWIGIGIILGILAASQAQNLPPFSGGSFM